MRMKKSSVVIFIRARRSHVAIKSVLSFFASVSIGRSRCDIAPDMVGEMFFEQDVFTERLIRPMEKFGECETSAAADRARMRCGNRCFI